MNRQINEQTKMDNELKAKWTNGKMNTLEMNTPKNEYTKVNRDEQHRMNKLENEHPYKWTL